LAIEIGGYTVTALCIPKYDSRSTPRSVRRLWLKAWRKYAILFPGNKVIDDAELFAN
jgi:hypothetical protein